ncbi:unnamed protein product [Brassicogethes aeneus]|uniref:Uncharacterized protein n=1 Tax=Brassicogethes aeneus TaxID=1431903 RepID=A0A9P0BCF2_BRAAE|nr:unnamed protein product [Brassicogethes aeneus]
MTTSLGLFTHISRLCKMSKAGLLQQYKKDVENVKNCAKNLGLSDGEVDRIIEESFSEINEQKCSKTKSQKCFYWMKLFGVVLFILMFVYVMLNVNQTTSSIVLRNVQGLIYPGMKLVSFKVFFCDDCIVDLYDESCLVENPFFYVSDLDCTPCKKVYSVIDLTNIDVDETFQSGGPFITMTNQMPVNLSYLQKYIKNNINILTEDVRRFTSNNKSISTLKDLINTNEKTINTLNFHSTWKINKMNPARIVRKIFPRPNFISKWSGQSVERFIMVDSPKSEPYLLPNTECGYVFVVQAFGQRTIVLKPANECKRSCKTLSVVLKQSYVLSYNWWYWRPISLPMENSTETSITYVNSYC